MKREELEETREKKREKERRIARGAREWDEGVRKEGEGGGGKREGSTHFHHLYTRRGNGGGGGGYLVDISVFPIPGVSALFHQFSLPPSPSFSLPRLPAYYL